MKKKQKYRNEEAFNKKIKDLVDINVANAFAVRSQFQNPYNDLLSMLAIEGYTEPEIKIAIKALLEMHRSGALQNLYNFAGSNFIPYPSY